MALTAQRGDPPPRRPVLEGDQPASSQPNHRLDTQASIGNQPSDSLATYTDAVVQPQLSVEAGRAVGTPAALMDRADLLVSSASWTARWQAGRSRRSSPRATHPARGVSAAPLARCWSARCCGDHHRRSAWRSQLRRVCSHTQGRRRPADQLATRAHPTGSTPPEHVGVLVGQHLAQQFLDAHPAHAGHRGAPLVEPEHRRF
jgi:hypothetical protein